MGKIDADKVQKAYEDIIKKFPVTLKETDVGYVIVSTHPPIENEALLTGEREWKSFKEYAKTHHHLNRIELNILFIALRAHYNWRGWVPSIAILAYM